MINKIKKLLNNICEEDVTQSKAFKRWFGNSQVVDAEGKPLIVYHGTNKDFQVFDNQYSAQGVHWFSSDKDKISRGESGAASSKKILACYLSCQKLAGWDLYDKHSLYEIEHMGYDGIKLDDDYVVFDNRKIKAVDNQGTFKKSSRNIYEEYLTTVPSTKNMFMIKDTDVFINPSVSEIAKIRRANGNNLRFILNINNNDVYVWDAGHAIHLPVMSYLSKNFKLHKSETISGVYDPGYKYFMFDMGSNKTKDPDLILHWLKQSPIPGMFSINLDDLQVSGDKYTMILGVENKERRYQDDHR